jgi:hypothetical protein
MVTRNVVLTESQDELVQGLISSSFEMDCGWDSHRSNLETSPKGAGPTPFNVPLVRPVRELDPFI